MSPWARRRVILTLLLALAALAVDPQPRAEEAWQALRMGQAQRALDLSASGWMQEPSLAAVHIAASRRVEHPLATAAKCRQLIPHALQAYPQARQVLRTCGWHLVSTRTGKRTAERAAVHLRDTDPYDHDARGLLVAVRDIRERAERTWDPPRADGSVRARRVRDFKYLYRYLRPEDGSLSVLGSWLVLPQDEAFQARTGVHSVLHLRDHERVPLGWRVAIRPEDPAAPRAITHQLHSGYRLSLWSRTTLLLDGSVILGEGRDEAAIRFRAERVGLGVWSADLAPVWTPWGRHLALQLGWDLTFEGLASVDLRVEGQAGKGGPRGLAELGVYRYVGRSVLRVDGQLGRATRPLGDRYLVRDLPGVEGAGASLSLEGPLSKRVRAQAVLGLLRLHPDLQAEAQTTGQVELALTGRW